jgi:hypothetical protein
MVFEDGVEIVVMGRRESVEDSGSLKMNLIVTGI